MTQIGKRYELLINSCWSLISISAEISTEIIIIKTSVEVIIKKFQTLFTALISFLHYLKLFQKSIPYWGSIATISIEIFTNFKQIYLEIAQSWYPSELVEFTQDLFRFCLLLFSKIIKQLGINFGLNLILNLEFDKKRKWKRNSKLLFYLKRLKFIRIPHLNFVSLS